MENIITAGLSVALHTKVVIGGAEIADATALKLDNVHKYTLKWQKHVIKESKTASGDMKIFVATLTGKTLALDVEASFSVDLVKQQIDDLASIPPEQQKLIFNSKILEDQQTLAECNIMQDSTLHLVIKSGGSADRMKIDNAELDPQYNYKYPMAETQGESYRRGQKKFERPYGWEKYAIKVLGKYDSNGWLGVTGRGDITKEVPGEWPVSYHGTSKMFSDSITEKGVELHKGKNFKFGRGVFSAPSPTVTEKYAIPFEFEGVKYKMIIMNRVNLEYTREVEEPGVGTYFVTSDDTQIRPYAILIKRV